MTLSHTLYAGEYCYTCGGFNVDNSTLVCSACATNTIVSYCAESECSLSQDSAVEDDRLGGHMASVYSLPYIEQFVNNKWVELAGMCCGVIHYYVAPADTIHLRLGYKSYSYDLNSVEIIALSDPSMSTVAYVKPRDGLWSEPFNGYTNVSLQAGEYWEVQFPLESMDCGVMYEFVTDDNGASCRYRLYIQDPTSSMELNCDDVLLHVYYTGAGIGSYPANEILPYWVYEYLVQSGASLWAPSLDTDVYHLYGPSVGMFVKYRGWRDEMRANGEIERSQWLWSRLINWMGGIYMVKGDSLFFRDSGLLAE